MQWPLTCYTLPLVVPPDLMFLILDSESVEDVLFFARENISLRYFSRTPPTCEPGILKWGPSKMELLDPGTREGRYFGEGRGILIWLGDNFCYWGSFTVVDIIFRIRKQLWVIVIVIKMMKWLKLIINILELIIWVFIKNLYF